MSQSKVNDFFTSKKKGNRDIQPSKRRKLDPATDDSEVIWKRPAISIMERRSQRVNVAGVKFSQENLDNSDKIVNETSAAAEPLPKSVPKVQTRATNPTPRKGKKSKSVHPPPSKGQQTLSFTTVVKDNSDSENVDRSSLKLKGNVTETVGKDSQDTNIEFGQSSFSQETKCMEEVTSVWDDHKNQECTPRKRIMTELDSLSQGPKSRVKKTAARKLNQIDQPDSSLPQSEVKKKLDLEEVQVGLQSQAEKEVQIEEVKSDDSSPRKARLLKMVSEMTSVEGAISPLALTPEHSTSPPDPTLAIITPKLHNLSEKLKVLSKMDGQALKNRLKKKGMLGEVKEKLHDLSKATADNKSAAPAIVEKASKEKSEEKLPAHQRYDYMVKEGPPTLTLPYAYRLLENAFQAMDTVVSMLHNRAEVCTFNKLQASVQNITKKNFLKKTAGQIKTVVPDAYSFKQERVPVFGQKNSPYVLTVEANLKDEDGETKNFTTKDGKISFSASVLLKRKTLFKANLLKMVKKHHRTFLESLTPPLRIPDDKLSRWHPKFALDKVEEVTPSDLPQPPNVQVYRSAKDVLELTMGKLNPRVEKALSKVVSESNSSQTKQDKVTKESQSPLKSSTPTPTQSSMKGIPPALLAKIRAKEALKMEQSLTRDPAEDRKMRMMGHLPEIIRILRSYFVTEKKPALPLESVIKKLGDSYHTGMSQGEIEQHIKLLKETAPELLSVVEIKRGKFVKLDKNIDITALSDRINNIVKAKK